MLCLSMLGLTATVLVPAVTIRTAFATGGPAWGLGCFTLLGLLVGALASACVRIGRARGEGPFFSLARALAEVGCAVLVGMAVLLVVAAVCLAL
jgi:hypothetical protein